MTRYGEKPTHEDMVLMRRIHAANEANMLYQTSEWEFADAAYLEDLEYIESKTYPPPHLPGHASYMMTEAGVKAFNAARASMIPVRKPKQQVEEESVGIVGMAIKFIQRLFR